MAELYDFIGYIFMLGQLLALASLPYFVALVFRFRGALDGDGRETSGEPARAMKDIATLVAKADGAGSNAVQHACQNSLTVRTARVASI